MAPKRGATAPLEEDSDQTATQDELRQIETRLAQLHERLKITTMPALLEGMKEEIQTLTDKRDLLLDLIKGR